MAYWRHPGLRFSLFLIVLLFGPAVVKCAQPPIRLSVDRLLGFPPLTITATVSIPRDPRNREACLIATVEGISSQSCWPLNGDNDRAQFQRTLKRLGSGRHHLVAQLRRSDGYHTSNVEIVSVLE